MSAQRSAARTRAEGEPEWLTLGQAARYLGVAQSTIRAWSDQGRVRAFYTPGGHRRFRVDDLAAFIDGSGPGGRRRGGPLVLVVDDDARLREFMRVSLEAAGYSVGEASGGEEALAAIADERPALVLLDVVMPGVDGWELLRRLEERHGSIPVIMFSGHADATAATGGVDDARDLSARPFDPHELLARAKQLVPA
jgi:excisionase family DNA binding protein